MGQGANNAGCRPGLWTYFRGLSLVIELSSVKVVVSPRNQRYLHPRSLGAGVFVCEVYEGCKLAVELCPELSTIWHEPDLFDELTDAFSGL